MVVAVSDVFMALIRELLSASYSRHANCVVVVLKATQPDANFVTTPNPPMWSEVIHHQLESRVGTSCMLYDKKGQSLRRNWLGFGDHKAQLSAEVPL